MASSKRIYKSSEPMIAGVCSGIAQYFRIDPNLARILAVAVTVATFGLPIILYLAGIAAIPANPAIKQGYIDAKATAGSLPATAASHKTTTGLEKADTEAETESEWHNSVRATASSMGRFARIYWNYVVIVGALLICSGIIILLGSYVNVSFWRFWPFILVIIGIIQLFTPSLRGWSLGRAGSAIVLITIGLVLLAWSLQVIASSAFILCFFGLWPMLLIAAGLYLIAIAKKLSMISLISSLLLSITLVVGFWYYGVADEHVSIKLPSGNVWEFVIPVSPLASTLDEGRSVEVDE
ncbi:MAG: PspC domain-containing protein [Coriobacteriia bacterium]|nr:PspC domain-containing protein [Coriobacteriia bacterium]